MFTARSGDYLEGVLITGAKVMSSELGIKRTLSVSYDQALAALPAALKAEGFGVLTEIDLQSTLKQKLGVDFRRYRILGACHPPSAYQALSADLDVGLMLPCNVVVYERDDGTAEVMAIDPTKTFAAAGSPTLVALAVTIKEKLSRALAALA